MEVVLVVVDFPRTRDVLQLLEGSLLSPEVLARGRVQVKSSGWQFALLVVQFRFDFADKFGLSFYLCFH